MTGNADLVRAFWEAFNRDDLEAALDTFDEAIELEIESLPEQVQTQHFHGHDGARELWRLNKDPFDELIVEILDVIETGDDVVVLACNHARGKSSGVTIEQARASVLTVHGDKIVRARFFTDHPQALEAAGLEVEHLSRDSKKQL